ncbi:Chemotaxis protein CheV [Photobacterium damselae subsp. piscicida]|uniref:Chemotaxis protein CheV n=1 Tax=Photobacterium damsela subsp. piscicida TaxID=38294 RepID=A0AAD1CDE5_PHODP|nr:Chemotaxis protein CheV [Photobacterium damselae subsp. piscicida]GAW44774.1 Chemotaxis protein CheV [Photobacterium damselae subsp. piscicida]
MPNLHPLVKGIAHIRGQTISVIDMSLATGGRPIEDLSNCFVIISEFNRSVQGFLVTSVERIINMNWESILPPPKGAGRSNYLTAVTEIDNELVEILDVEKILDEISPADTDITGTVLEDLATQLPEVNRILVADDSTVARKQVQRAIEAIGYECVLVKDGREALNTLKEMAKEGSIYDQLALVISDMVVTPIDLFSI